MVFTGRVDKGDETLWATSKFLEILTSNQRLGSDTSNNLSVNTFAVNPESGGES